MSHTQLFVRTKIQSKEAWGCPRLKTLHTMAWIINLFCQYKEIDLWLEKLGLCCEKESLLEKCYDYLNTSNQTLFKNSCSTIWRVCVFVKTSMCARRYYFLRNKKIAIYFDNGDCSMHANYKQISKSIYNTQKVFVILFLPQISSKLWIYTCNYSYTWPSVLLPLETRRKQIVDLWEWIILPNQPTQQTS